MRLWLKVSADEYELPEAVADTSAELGKMTGANADTIRSVCYQERCGKIRGTVYKTIEVQEEDE